MAQARKAKGLFVVTPNEIGTLAKVTHTISSSGINIIALCGYAAEQKGNFLIVTDNSVLASKKLTERVYEAHDKEVVLVDFDNKTGTLEPVAKKLGDSGIDIDCVYGTAADGKKVLGVFLTKDNDKAVKIINA